MTVVEAYVGRKKMDPPDDAFQLNHLISSLLIEGIAHNTQGNVYVPKVLLSSSLQLTLRNENDDGSSVIISTQFKCLALCVIN